jgi:Flp pilus assembly protein TadD
LNEVYNDLGAAQAQRQGYAEAESNFRKALEGDDTDPDFHFNLGVALWRGGKFAEAADSFRAVLARNAADNEATSLLGRCLKKEPARLGDTRSDGKLRLKTNYEENAFRQLQAELGKK